MASIALSKYSLLTLFLFRRVRDRLIADDQFKLAMEVSMKCQLETAGVWTAWGMACIKAGEFLSAREKFRHCLKVFAFFYN